MTQRLSERTITRRVLLRILATVGLGPLLAPPLDHSRPAEAQGNLANLGPEEPVEATLKRLFGARPINDGASSIKLDLPLIAENGAVVPISV